MEFTILIVTYHPDWSKLLLTLESVRKQTFRDYEIVVSDDGSEDNLFDKVEQYFKEHGITEYTLLPHKKNRGTVQNIIAGLEVAKGKYVRDFGPGDTFYNENSLQNIHEFFVKRQCEACFGLMRGYRIDKEGKVQYCNFDHPFDLMAYQKKEYERIQKNLVLYRDNVSGAVTCYTRKFYLEYMKKIEGKVVYTEDIFQIMAGLDGRYMEFYPNYLVWYEADSGISTKTKSSFAELLNKDVRNFYQMIQTEYPQNNYVQRQKKVAGLYKIQNLYVRTLIRMFVNPDLILYLIRHMIQKILGWYRSRYQESGFLETEEFIEIIQGERKCKS